jgi:two-component system response regulator AtoC
MGMTPPGRILLIEDDPTLGEVLQMVWTEEGYTVEVAPHLKAAIERLEQARFNLVVTDNVVVRWDPTLAWLADLRLHLGGALLVLSTGREEARALDPVALGLAAVWIKPFDLDEVLRATKLVLSP